MALGKDDSGHIEYLFAEGDPHERVPWFHSPPFQLGLFAAVVVLFFSACIAWPIEFLIRRRKRVSAQKTPATARG